MGINREHCVDKNQRQKTLLARNLEHADFPGIAVQVNGAAWGIDFHRTATSWGNVAKRRSRSEANAKQA